VEEERSESSARNTEESRESMSEHPTKVRGRRKTQVGRVVSNKMDKTVIVAVERLVQHPRYKKYIRRTSRIYAHDGANACNMGDVVRIIETRPLSKLKRWRVLRVVKQAR
jgi:small subunit ribosomal protein S17